MGLFNVNMPLLYGEGLPKAFYRLQEGILKSSSDQSIFAWSGTNRRQGLLATAPHDFRYSQDVGLVPNSRMPQNLPVQTPQGLSLSLLTVIEHFNQYVVLDCQIGSRT